MKKRILLLTFCLINTLAFYGVSAMEKKTEKVLVDWKKQDKSTWAELYFSKAKKVKNINLPNNFANTIIDKAADQYDFNTLGKIRNDKHLMSSIDLNSFQAIIHYKDRVAGSFSSQEERQLIKFLSHMWHKAESIQDNNKKELKNKEKSDSDNEESDNEENVEKED